MIARVEIHPGRYHDSVRLMQASKVLQEVEGVVDALVAMATELNLSLLADMGFDTDAAAGAGPNDLLVALRAESEEVMAAAHRVLDDALSRKATQSGGLDAPDPKTAGSAAAVADANIVVLSVPGEHAFVEAMEALELGRHVMIFSDNVPIEQEIILKRYGADHDLLVMGPDCGTAIVNGVGQGQLKTIADNTIDTLILSDSDFPGSESNLRTRNREVRNIESDVTWTGS